MKRSWTALAAALGLLVCCRTALAGEPAALAQQYYEQALQICPYDCGLGRISLVLPAAPLVTAATLTPPSVPAEDGHVLAFPSAEHRPSLNADAAWYRDRAALPAEDAFAVLGPSYGSSAGYEYDYDYGYQYDYDYSESIAGGAFDEGESYGVIGDEELEPFYGYDSRGRTLREVPTVETLADAELEQHYGYDAQGRPLERDYRLGYSEYDDPFADDYLTHYHSLLHDVEQPRDAGVQSQWNRVVEMLAAADWRQSITSLVEQVRGSHPARQAMAWFEQSLALAEKSNLQRQAELYYYEQHGSGKYSFIESQHAAYERFVEGVTVEAVPAEQQPAVELQALRTLARTLDRAGAALQGWSRQLETLAHREAQTAARPLRLPAATEAR